MDNIIKMINKVIIKKNKEDNLTKIKTQPVNPPKKSNENLNDKTLKIQQKIKTKSNHNSKKFHNSYHLILKKNLEKTKLSKFNLKNKNDSTTDDDISSLNLTKQKHLKNKKKLKTPKNEQLFLNVNTPNLTTPEVTYKNNFINEIESSNLKENNIIQNNNYNKNSNINSLNSQNNILKDSDLD